MQRQRDLERCGWTFVRIKSSAYYRDREQALEALWGKLDRLKVRPTSMWDQQQDELQAERNRQGSPKNQGGAPKNFTPIDLPEETAAIEVDDATHVSSGELEAPAAETEATKEEE